MVNIFFVWTYVEKIQSERINEQKLENDERMLGKTLGDSIKNRVLRTLPIILQEKVGQKQYEDFFIKETDACMFILSWLKYESQLSKNGALWYIFCIITT